MIKKKHIMVLALAFCLTATLFVVTSIGYDPWVDQDEDGDIDASDLNVLSQEYGTAGDPTKNVSVTNWPESEKPHFSEYLVLRGLRYVLRTDWRVYPSSEYAAETAQILMDENAPYPYLGWTYDYTYLCYGAPVAYWVKESELNFTYVPANSPFFIQGDVTIRPTFYHYFTSTAYDVLHWNITVHLEKVTPETTVVLASDTIIQNCAVNTTVNETVDFLGVILRFPEPVLVERGERLQIRFETWMRSQWGWINLFEIHIKHTLGTDQFIAYIPILQP